MSPDPPTLADQVARDRIARDLDATLFVEAGAGSGKTRSLVERVIALVGSGAAELRAIAAITFTEKAGAELRDRLRRELQARVSDATDADGTRRFRDALDQLDSAAIGTLHSFAQRILSENPIEAGLPPRVEVLDAVSSGVEFERRWGTFRDRLFEDPAVARALLIFDAAGVRIRALDVLAAAFGENWDLVETQVPETAPAPPDARTALAPLLDELVDICHERHGCRELEDKLSARLEQVANRLDGVRSLDELDLLEVVSSGELKVARNIGQQRNWPDVGAVRDRLKSAFEALEQARVDVCIAAAKQIASAIRTFTLEAAAERRAAGRLEFHDLLVLARALLRDPNHGATVRERLHARYQRLLLDEFQDTDPIQIELAVRIAAADPGSADAGERSWDQVAVAPGHLFVVGDPKQSIYRFRRADIGTFLAARDRFADERGMPVELTANFRTVEPVIDFVNEVFAALMTEPPENELPLVSRPPYLALDPQRDTPPAGAPTAVLGREEHPADVSADDLRAEEANEVAAAVAGILAGGWSVDDGNDGWRPARLADIAILLPARTSLPFLQDALDGEGIAYRSESSSLVYATRTVRDLMMVLRAVDDPTNELHLVAALRSTLIGCGDDDLFRFKVERKGSWSLRHEPPPTVPDDDPVRRALAYLRTLYDRRHWDAPSELLDRIARDRRAFELGFAEGRPRDVWRQLRFVIDQARQWSEATNGNLREYLRWVEVQSAEGSRVQESVLPETDDDAVRIMTIHAAKGLEFPITIVSGMSTAPQRRYAPAEVVFLPSGEVGYKFGKAIQTSEYQDWKPIDEQMDYDERIRLLYVACTRARDHLVVSMHRKARNPSANGRTNAELLHDGAAARLDALPDAVQPERQLALGTARAVTAPAAPVMPFAEWQRERADALGRASRPTAVAATALTDDGDHDPAGDLGAGLQKRPRDLDLPPWLKGRYGTAVGRAVHGVLQTIDLATAAGIDAAVAAQCEAEAIPDRAEHVRALVDAALGAPAVRAAAAAAHWREVYACAPIDGRLLEGYVDLLYRGTEGLVVVDYKTAATDDRAELDRRRAGYRLQGASYALTIAATTGEPVARVTFLFLTPHGAVELDLEDLDAAVADVRALVAAGQEIVIEDMERSA
jgi:ATP-dependent exoDNAse (exonuclease V) beta subunit